MRDYVLRFELAPCRELDNFALLADQAYNYGDKNEWFSDFRGGLFGFFNRIEAVARHYLAVHAWVPVPRTLDADYQLSSILFNMDSSVECFVFALNALGNSAFPSEFRDITQSRSLRKISPADILDIKNPLFTVYTKHFPKLQSLWTSNANLLQVITDCHDVSKHRSTIFSGGKCQIDAPAGFWEVLGLQDNIDAQWPYWPMEEILLRRDAKLPTAQRVPTPVPEQVLLEDVAEKFVEFVNSTVRVALEDARCSFKLPVPQWPNS
jgi:hypothetical protein